MEKPINENIVDRSIDCILNIYKKNTDISDDQQAVLKYSIRLLISSILSFTMTLGLALILGTFPSVLVIIITVSLYRAFSGGAHCSSMGNCAIYGALTLNTIGLMTKLFKPTTSAMISMIACTFIFSLWAAVKYAPADTPGKPISTKVKRQKLKKMSVMVICIWVLGGIGWYANSKTVNVLIFSSTAAVMWQSFTLTAFGYKFCHTLDSVISRLRFK